MRSCYSVIARQECHGVVAQTVHKIGNVTLLSWAAKQYEWHIFPFALSMSKGLVCFDKLSTNGLIDTMKLILSRYL